GRERRAAGVVLRELDTVGGAAEARAQHDADARNERGLPADRLDQDVDHGRVHSTNRKRTGTTTQRPTGVPLLAAGRNFHFCTVSSAATSKSGIDWTNN